jgi:copper transport protein
VGRGATLATVTFAALTDPEALRALGLGLAIPSLCVSAGLLAFVAFVHRGPRAEVFALVRLAQRAAAVAVAGAAIEAAGVARLFGTGWTDALTSGRAPAALLRLAGAALIVIGLFEPPVTRRVGDADEERWSPAGAGVFAAVGALVGLVSFQFDGHTVSRGPRGVHAALDFVHVTAGSVWAGGVIGLVAVYLRRRTAVVGLAHAFGRLATVTLVVVAAAGVAMSLLIVETPGDYVDSPWGRRLLIKLAAVAVAAAIGTYHHFRAVPTGADLRRSLTVEALALLAVLVVTALLVRASPV